MSQGSCLLFHPIFLISLVMLVVNDHILESLYPSFLTGKLSDFAGPAYFP